MTQHIPESQPDTIDAVGDLKSLLQEAFLIYRLHWRVLSMGFALMFLATVLLGSAQILALLVLPHVFTGYYIMQLRALRGQLPRPSDMLQPFTVYLPILMANLFKTVLVMPVEIFMTLGFGVYILPMLDPNTFDIQGMTELISKFGLEQYHGSMAFNAVIAIFTILYVVMSLALSQTLYILADIVMAESWDRLRRNATTEAWLALKKSLHLMRGRITQLFAYGFIFMLIGLSGLAFFMFGVMFTAPLGMLGFAVFYNRLVGGGPTPPPVEAPPSEI